MDKKDWTGQKVGAFSIIGHGRKEERKDRPGCFLYYWKCQCFCGNVVEYTPSGFRQNASCGCEKRKNIGKANTTHGESSGGKLTPEYEAWRRMHRRCSDPRSRDYPDYGAKGIAVCERWSTVEAFIEDMGRKPSPLHSIDRIDGSKGYSPNNCRWATKKEQAQNRRNVIWLTLGGETLCVADWAKRLGLNSQTLCDRLKRGLPIERVLNKERYKTGPKPK